MRIPLGVLLLAAILASSCAKENKKNHSINGVWESIGSGWILEIVDSSKYTMYDITRISCLQNRKSTLDEILTSIELREDTLCYKLGYTTYKFTRTEKLPSICSNTLEEKKVKDPFFNFEVFAETVKEHYAFMEINGLDWDELYNQQWEKLGSNPGNAQLYLTIEETLELMNDNHAYLEATDDVYEEVDKISKVEEETGEDEVPEIGDFVIADKVSKHHLENDMTKDSWLINWGTLTDDIGFIQIKSMWLHADLDIPKSLQDEIGFVNAFIETRYKLYEGDYIEREVQAARKIMEAVMNDLSEMRAIVIDVRFNGGGQDAVSFEILSRFVSERLQIGTQKLRHGNHFSPVLPLYCEGRKDAFTKPVYVLTSPQTGSAAEAFSIATMALDNAIRIGSSTMGALSTTLDKTLPNGWIFSISNEIGMDNQGNAYENIGVPVDHDLGYPRERQTFFRSVVDDLEADKESILEAIEELEME